MSEFNIIHKYFAPLSKDGLQDDCAALDVPAGHTLLVSTDTLNAGVHFFADTPPDIIARKALRSTVSDIYASGGRPLAYQLAIGFPGRRQRSGWRRLRKAWRRIRRAMVFTAPAGIRPPNRANSRSRLL